MRADNGTIRILRGAPGTDLTLTSPLIYVVPGDPKGRRWEAPPSAAKEGGVTMREISALSFVGLSRDVSCRLFASLPSKALNHTITLCKRGRA